LEVLVVGAVLIGMSVQAAIGFGFAFDMELQFFGEFLVDL